MLRILLVCSGNTCRSPMAETLLKAKINESGLADKVQVLSAGLYAAGEMQASNGAMAAMRRRGLDLSLHRSRQVLPDFVQAADLVLTMTVSHKRMLVAAVPEFASKVYTLAEYAGDENDVVDPFGGNDEVYECCALEIEHLLDKAWQKIVDYAGKI
ncbi:MAG: protein tyrosine phosphatase [Firmicutes bacterium]|nr:protein tyrosine phosphatase [Bacillota bacterium]